MKCYNLAPVSLIIGILTLSGCNDYTVGVTTMVFSDTEITRKISPEMQALLELEENDSRDLMVKIWYPTHPEQNEASRFHYGYHTEQNDYPLLDVEENRDALNFLRENQQQSRSYQNASPLSDQPFPVIFYSHGGGDPIEDNEPYYESLVKKGYIVASIGHTSETTLVTLNNAQTVPINEDVVEDAEARELPFVERDPNLEFTVHDAETLAKISLGEPPTKDLLQRYHYSKAQIRTGAQDHIDLWVLDAHFLLAQLEKINQGEITSNLEGIFDLNRIGSTGYSFGASVATRFCNEEPRCLASINIDGPSLALFDEKIRVPHIQYISDVDGSIAAEIREGEDLANEGIEERRQALFIEKQNESHATINAANTDFYLVTLESIAHEDYHLGWLDTHDFGLGKAVWHAILESTSIDFFDTYIKKSGVSQELLCYTIKNNKNVVLDFTNTCD